MTYADFDYYQNAYHGILITSANDYASFAERAGDELAPFANRVPDTEEAQTALKRCACRIADILYGDWKQSKNGVSKISSESVSGYYSVSYATPTYGQIRLQINSAIALYIGRYVLGARKVML